MNSGSYDYYAFKHLYCVCFVKHIKNYYLCLSMIADMRKLLTYIVFVLYSSFACLGAVSSGLFFHSHAKAKEDRTSFYIEPDVNLKRGFFVEFDLSLRLEKYNYGYVFRIVIDDKKSIDLIANFSEKSRSLTLIEGEHLYLDFPNGLLGKYKWGEWANVSLSVNRDSVSITFDNIKISEPYNLNSLAFDNIKLYFGGATHPLFYSSDIPPMSIRNLKLSDYNHHVLYHWLFREHCNDICFDSIKKYPLQVSNPEWIIDQHTKWTKELTLKLPANSQACNAENHNSLYFANNGIILKYILNENKVDTIVTQGGPFLEENNQLIYVPYFNELWSYDFNDGKTKSIFNFATKEWTENDLEIKNPQYSQHNAFLSNYDSCLYIFGGYGDYTYKNKILKTSRNNNFWQEVKYTDKIPPRYLGAMGYKSKDTLLIFGGCGNPKGKQEFGVTNYYDLYSLDVKNLTVKKLWENKSLEKEGFVVGNNIVVDKDIFYALCYPSSMSNTHILLKAFFVNDSLIHRNYADTIPYVFNDVHSSCNLYYNPTMSKLYAVTKNEDGGNSIFNIYSLRYPPLTIVDTQQPEEYKSGAIPLIVITFAILLLLIIFLYLYLLKRHLVKPKPATESNRIPENITNNEVFVQPKKSAIFFLNGFQVWDKEGNDITKLFTPVLKQLLIIITIYSRDNQKGISNITLRETFWSDKSDESAQNNRRVNIRKLKVLLEKLDGIDLVKENIYWFLKFNGAYCDYLEIYKFIRKVETNVHFDSSNCHEIPFQLLSYPLLPYVQCDWLDPIKADYSNVILDTSILLSKQEGIKNNNDILIQIANVMFAHDKIDEYALIMKCQALHRNGRTSLAKNEYDSFCDEYKEVLNIEYNKSFNDVINSPLKET